jgi:hypothetical protein
VFFCFICRAYKSEAHGNAGGRRLKLARGQVLFICRPIRTAKRVSRACDFKAYGTIGLPGKKSTVWLLLCVSTERTAI